MAREIVSLQYRSNLNMEPEKNCKATDLNIKFISLQIIKWVRQLVGEVEMKWGAIIILPYDVPKFVKHVLKN